LIALAVVADAAAAGGDDEAPAGSTKRHRSHASGAR
jgi:hypothetical protein